MGMGMVKMTTKMKGRVVLEIWLLKTTTESSFIASNIWLPIPFNTPIHKAYPQDSSALSSPISRAGIIMGLCHSLRGSTPGWSDRGKAARYKCYTVDHFRILC